MRKLCLCALILLLAAGGAFADAMIPIVQYKCLICEKKFYGFEGDELDSEEINDPDIQLRRVFQLADRGKNLDPCSSNFKAHVFDLVMVMLRPVSEIARNSSRIAVLKDGGNLKNTTISVWRCLAPDCSSGKGPFYTLNEDSLMQKDWEQQADRILSLKGSRKIPKCQSRYTWGHAFYCDPGKKKSPVKSYDIAQMAYDIYYVK